MRIVTGLAIALTSVGSAVYFVGTGGDAPKPADHLANVTQIGAGGSTQLMPTRATPAAPQRSATAVPAPSEQTPAAATPAPVTSFIALVAPKPADPGTRRLSSSRPADEDARRELVKDLQRELKRVGCFEGEISGQWGSSSKKAMSAFTDRVNATLPLDEPDYILLTLVQGHSAQACGNSCPTGQAMNEDGKCLPRAIVAQKAKRSTGKTVTAGLDMTPTGSLEPSMSRMAKQPAAAKTAGSWATVVTVPPPSPAPRNAPLPGRMAVGAPVELPALTPEADRANAELAKRKAELAAAEAEPRRTKDALAWKKAQQGDAAQKKAAAEAAKPAQSEQSDNNADTVVIAAAARQAALNKPQVELARQGQSSTGVAAVPRARAAHIVVQPAPRFGPPPYAVGRIATAAPRPSYGAEPRRWTRTFFTDITRMH